MITRQFGIPVTSTGAILRRERDLGTPLGQETAEVLRSAGRLQCGECGFTTSSSSAQFANRPVCPYCDGRLERRNDDDLSVLQTCLQEFRTKTEPLASFYEKMSILHRIDGNRDREAVFSDISRLIEDKR